MVRGVGACDNGWGDLYGLLLQGQGADISNGLRAGRGGMPSTPGTWLWYGGDVWV